jgi:hypothetical protein
MSSFGSRPEDQAAALAALVALIEKSVRGMDQKLGYHGADRFVVFYYESRGGEVVWRDSQSYGFATGAGQLFIDDLAPIAELHNVNVGGSATSASHVLLIDRRDQRAYFVERDEAFRFLEAVATRHRRSDVGIPAEIEKSLATSVEITQESIAKLAYRLWERNGRLEGRALNDWLEAEIELTKKRWASRQGT